MAIADDRLTTGGLRTEARAADGDRQTDLLAKAGAQMVDAMSAAAPDASEILALDPARLTLRPAGVDDPPVIACHALSRCGLLLPRCQAPLTTVSGNRSKR